MVVPAYNESASLGECLESLASQDFAGTYEVIVIDNNSTDPTAEIARLHGATVVFEQHPGVCWARQAGTLLARGEIVVSTDADTTFERGWLSRIDQTFSASPDCVAVAAPCRFFGAPLWGRLYVWLLFHVVHLVAASRAGSCTPPRPISPSAGAPGLVMTPARRRAVDELGLLRRLRSRGRIAFDVGNPCLTSSRRLRQGLAYNLVVTCLYYYLLGYAINRLVRRPLIGTAPAFRAESRSATPGQQPARIGVTVSAATVCMAPLIAAGGLLTYVAHAR